MRCSSCGRLIEEDHPHFCPHCGALLAGPPSQASSSTTRPSRSIHEAPTRTSSSSPPVGGQWANNYGQPVLPQEAPATHASLYHTPNAAPELRAGSTPRPSTPKANWTGQRDAGAPGKRLFLVVIGLLLALLLLGGVGVSAYQLGLHQVQSTAKPTSAATATRPPLPTATAVERVIFSDPLTSPAYPWQQDSTHCLFQNGSYHIIKDYICFAPLGVYSDLNISVQVKQISGIANTIFGIVFRFNDANNYYDFRVSSNSLWLFEKFVNGVHHYLVPLTANAAIQPGIGTANTIRVRAHGTHLQFFANGIQIGQVTDSTFPSGDIGLYGPSTSVPGDVAFNNFQVTVSNY